jgi:hypothetical protein
VNKLLKADDAGTAKLHWIRRLTLQVLRKEAEALTAPARVENHK